MILLYGLFGLGLSELIIVLVAIIILLNPKSVTLIKPLVKSAYKMWLGYKREVLQAEREMEEMKKEVMKPIEEAEREAEREVRSAEALARMKKKKGGS